MGKKAESITAIVAVIAVTVIVVMIIASQPKCRNGEVRVRATLGTACVTGHY